MYIRAHIIQQQKTDREYIKYLKLHTQHITNR